MFSYLRFLLKKYPDFKESFWVALLTIICGMITGVVSGLLFVRGHTLSWILATLVGGGYCLLVVLIGLTFDYWMMHHRYLLLSFVILSVVLSGVKILFYPMLVGLVGAAVMVVIDSNRISDDAYADYCKEQSNNNDNKDDDNNKISYHPLRLVKFLTVQQLLRLRK